MSLVSLVSWYLTVWCLVSGVWCLVSHLVPGLQVNARESRQLAEAFVSEAFLTRYELFFARSFIPASARFLAVAT